MVSYQGLALQWTFLFMMSSTIVYEEYSTLFFNQLGLSTSAIGIALLIAIPFLLLVPILGFLGDKFRARKFILVILILLFIVFSLAPLLPLLVNFDLCSVSSNVAFLSGINETGEANETFFRESNLSHFVKSFTISSNVPWFPENDTKSNRYSQPNDEIRAYSPMWSVLFVYVAVVKTCYALVERATGVLLNVATVTYLKNERANYGSFYFWAQMGAGFTLLLVGLLASKFKYVICDHVEHGYFVAFYVTALTTTFSLAAMPWIKYEYLETRVTDWVEVRGVFTKGHYLFMLVLNFYFGCCFAFQHHWEFWYIAELNGSPAIMGIGGLVRRPFVAIWFMVSGQLIRRIGELQTLAITVFVYGAAMLSLSLITIPWLVLAVDAFQSAGFAFSYSASTVHFSKAASKASSGVVQGMADMVFAIGNEAGAGLIGMLFNAIGSKQTLVCYSIVSLVILVAYLIYLVSRREQLDQYERLPTSDNESEDGKRVESTKLR